MKSAARNVQKPESGNSDKLKSTQPNGQAQLADEDGSYNNIPSGLLKKTFFKYNQSISDYYLNNIMEDEGEKPISNEIRTVLEATKVPTTARPIKKMKTNLPTIQQFSETFPSTKQPDDIDRKNDNVVLTDGTGRKPSFNVLGFFDRFVDIAKWIAVSVFFSSERYAEEAEK